jgi:hypothetical protein
MSIEVEIVTCNVTSKSPFCTRTNRKVLDLQALALHKLFLVEIDKVVVKNYYGCEKNMNINHY